MIIKDDPELLELLVGDAKAQDSLYRPGPYWDRKVKIASSQIRKHGLADFRGTSTTVGQSFSDNTILDIRQLSGSPRTRVLRRLLNSSPLRGEFDQQVRLTSAALSQMRDYRSQAWDHNPRVMELLRKYSLENSVNCGCIDSVRLQGNDVSAHYLQILDAHDQIAAHLDHTRFTSMIEIGGGFGAYVHLLVSNYPSLRKILYVDISPPLYVATQYLRALYGSSVISFRETAHLGKLRFSEDDRLEILCVPPSQLSKFEGTLGLLHNANSFVEMPSEVVANYARLLRPHLGQQGAISLASYHGGDSRSLEPSTLPNFFSGDFLEWEAEGLSAGTKFSYFVRP